MFSTRADTNVGIVNQYVLNSRGIVQGSGSSVIGFWNPTGGLPASPSNGDRYVASVSANGWTVNNVVVYDETLDVWKNIVPTSGSMVWFEDLQAPRIWNPDASDWQELSVIAGGVN